MFTSIPTTHATAILLLHHVVAGLLVPRLSAPDTRIHTDDPAKNSRQMRLIAHSTILGDHGQTRVRFQHELLTTADPLSRDVGQRRLAEALAERSEEVTGTKPHDVREVGSANGPSEIGCNVLRQALLLPVSKAATMRGRPLCRPTMPTALTTQELYRALDAGFGGITVGIETFGRGSEQLPHSLAIAEMRSFIPSIAVRTGSVCRV